MIEVPLRDVPSQEFNFQADETRIIVRLFDTGRCMAVDLTINGEVVLLGQRIVAGTPFIPYVYMERGNLILLTEGGQEPDWQQFGITQSLLYLTADEVVVDV